MEQLQERHVSQPFTVNALDDILRKLSLPPPWTVSPLSSYTVGRRSFLSRADEEGLLTEATQTANVSIKVARNHYVQQKKM